MEDNIKFFDITHVHCMYENMCTIKCTAVEAHITVVKYHSTNENFLALNDVVGLGGLNSQNNNKKFTDWTFRVRHVVKGL